MAIAEPPTDVVSEHEQEIAKAWDEAQFAAISRGWRIDAPVLSKDRKTWTVVATWLPEPNARPLHLTGRGETPLEAIRAFLAEIPEDKPLITHCATCSCSPEDLANAQ